jgi:L-ascorbate metabolism protein UlaG (beta-lactamase superfamily)
VRLDLDGVRLLTDPVLGRVGPAGVLRRHAPPVPAAALDVDAVLLSHLHGDHCDLPSLAALGPRVRLVVPSGAAPLLEPIAPGRVTELAVGQSVRIGEVHVTATPALHEASRREGTALVQPVGFRVRGTREVYVAGDTDLFPGMVDLAGADVALLPVAGWGPVLGPGHMDALGAANALRLLRPRMAVPVHWGTLRIAGVWRLRRSTYLHAGAEFRTYARRMAPYVRVVVPAVGDPVDLPLAR